MITISVTGNYEKRLAALNEANSEISSLVDQAVNRFKNNPSDTRLNLHELRKRLAGKWAIDVTDDIRIVFRWLGKQHAQFLTIGPHEDVYPGYRKLLKNDTN